MSSGTKTTSLTEKNLSSSSGRSSNSTLSSVVSESAGIYLLHFLKSKLHFKSTCFRLILGCMNSLSTVEVVVSKYLAPKLSTTTETTKRIVKRPYRVSATDLDVSAEIVLKKKNDQKLMKKKSIDNFINMMPTANSKKRKTSSNTTTIRLDPELHKHFFR